MNRLIVLIVVFLLTQGLVFGIAETEPNDSYGAAGIVNAENGINSGTMGNAYDLDWWRVDSFPGDVVTVSTMWLTNLDTLIYLYNDAGTLITIADDCIVGGVYYRQASIQFTATAETSYYVRINTWWGQTGDYAFSVSGLFISPHVNPANPQNLSIADGAQEVPLSTASLSWTWGDGSHGRFWFFRFGTNPDNLDIYSQAQITQREGNLYLPYALFEGENYYYRFEFMNEYTYSQTPLYSFSTILSPQTVAPPNGLNNSNTNLRLSWQGGNAPQYDVGIGTDPGNMMFWTVNHPYFDALDLQTQSTYHWKVRSHYANTVSQWTPTASFSTQQYATPWHQDSSLYIHRVVFGAIDHSSGWEGYANYSGTPEPVQTATDLPISVELIGGFGPEGVRVWIDVNRDAVFDNQPGSGEYWDIPWGTNCFQGTIRIPGQTLVGQCRMRVQGIRTNLDGHSPSGLLQSGDSEDYLLDISSVPILSIIPSSASFGETPVGQNAGQTAQLSLTNSGGGTCFVDSIYFTGPDSDSFYLMPLNNFPLIISNSSVVVEVGFNPQRAGLITTELVFSDSYHQSSVHIPISGLGVQIGESGAIAFDGSGEYIEIPSAPALENLSALTIETWFKAQATQPIQFLTAKSMESMEIHTDFSSGRIRFIPTTGVYLDSWSGVLIPDQWMHLACVYDPAAGLAKIYLDGRDVTWQNNGFNPLSTPLISSSLPLLFGFRQDGTYAFRGALDEMRIWNYVRSQTQLRDNMQLRQSLPAPGLVANWRFDELNGNTAFEPVNNLKGIFHSLEPEDHISSPVLIENGSSCTLIPSATGVWYDFTSTGLKLNFSTLETAGEITVTRFNHADSEPGVLTGQSWILRSYDNSPRTASIQGSVQEDVTETQLPAYNFSLQGRLPFSDSPWGHLCRGTAADIDNNSITFEAVSCSSRQFRIVWARLTPPAEPQGLNIVSESGSVHLQWNPVTSADRYKVFSSATPDGIFTEDHSGVFNGCSWTAPLGEVSRFYRIVANLD